MLFRFTLSNDIEGAHIITDPDGWKEIKLKLERDKEYHSLVEVVELPLIFYRSSDLVDGGYDYIRNVENTQGIDALIQILIEVSEDQGQTYDTFFNGLLELSTIKDISDAAFYKLECNIVRNDFWSKFFNRKSQQVNLNASVDLDGNDITPIQDIELQLPSQRLRQNSDYRWFESVPYNASTGRYFILDWEIVNLEEVKTKFNYPRTESSTVPLELLALEFAGSYTFNVSLFASQRINLGGGLFDWDDCSGTLDMYIQINNGTPVAFTATDFTPGGGASDYTTYTYTGTHILEKGDFVRIYADVPSGSGNYGIWGENLPNEDISTLFGGSNPDFTTPPTVNNFLGITADTTYTDTVTDAFLLRDAAESVLSKIIGRNNVLFSNYLGDETPTACAANFAIMKGLHVRGYSMTSQVRFKGISSFISEPKPMFMSFDDWWNGANPIFNLGLGYETIAGTEYIRIEHKGGFYDETPSMTLSNIEKIVRVYDKDRIFKSIEIGYEKWAAESASGVDDPQTKHTYNTRFKIIGKDENVLSKFIAASLAIEQTRRNRIEFGKDWRLDEDTIIIALNNDSSPYQPELDEEFSNIVNLLNSDTRYNIRLTPARNFERWKPYFNGCLQVYVNNSPCEYYNFASGEGNYDTVTTGEGFCDSGRLGESDDLCVTTDHYATAQMYEFEDDMSFQDYRTLRNNRKNCILVSETNTDHRKFFIDEAEYDHFNAICKFTGWIKE
jgi:hypothetical protein